VLKKNGKTWRRVGYFADREAELVIYDIKDNGVHRLKTYVDNNRRPVEIIWNGKDYLDPGDSDLPQRSIVCDSSECP
jgi:hypothetical protein